MYEKKVRDLAGPLIVELAPDTEAAMWRLFAAIGKHWATESDSLEYRSRLSSFMRNRVALMPIYADYYSIAARVLKELVDAHAGDLSAACAEWVSSRDASKQPPSTPLALTRQMVCNEFTTLHMALGACTVFGAKNGVGYFGGANVPGCAPPYRPRS